MREMLEEKLARFEELEQMMTDPEVLSNSQQMAKVAREHGALAKLATRYRTFKQIAAEISEVSSMAESDDSEERELAEMELPELKEKREACWTELLDLTITPPTAGFSFATEPELPGLLSAWSTGLCPGGDASLCSAQAAGCEDDICVDAEGYPLTAFRLPVTFNTAGLPANATLTVELDEGDGAIQHDVQLAGLPTQLATRSLPQQEPLDTRAFPSSARETHR